MMQLYSLPNRNHKVVFGRSIHFACHLAEREMRKAAIERVFSDKDSDNQAVAGRVARLIVKTVYLNNHVQKIRSIFSTPIFFASRCCAT